MEQTPTQATYETLSQAYDFFNAKLFDGKLPPCLLTLQRRGKRTLGFFAPKRFQSDAQTNTDELAMNPVHFGARELVDTLSTLVHEMTHVEQEYFGKPGRRGYHNKDWGALMKRVGLHPSNTGKPGGKETGQQMHHYVIEGGPFDLAAQEIARAGFKFTWSEVDPSAPAEEGTGPEGGAGEGQQQPDRSNRVKYKCPGAGCKAQAWGKPSLLLICGVCKLEMLPKGRHPTPEQVEG